MAQIRIEKYTPDLFEQWNKFVEESNNGTIFHRLDFLNYHGEKFKKQEHHLVWYKGDEIFAVLPLAIFEKNNSRVAKSPYGASYGGIVFSEQMNYSNSKKIILCIIEYLKKQEINEIIITFPIKVIDKIYSETFYFTLLEEGFRIINSDISSVVCLDKENIESETFTSRIRNMARKARKANVVPELKVPVNDFWKVMEKTFEKHKTNPTHTFEEWKWLCVNLPNDVWCDVAYMEEKPIAGIGHFRINSKVDSSFYLCSDSYYKKTQALSLLIYETILNSQKDGFKYFDFGTSSANMVARENIFRFKESFGATGLFRNTYKWKNE